ncbi:MAG TPA: phytanoyl-CoA dioxygenase family protein [Acidimicrobiales bacterium]|nr:phytanoyl-CoA dioxygenase family protein [Acidimicrobiales bacterium]
MDDHEVLDFCRNGYLMLERVVPEEVNAQVMEYCQEHAGDRGEIPVGEPWYVSAVTLNPALTGVVRSLLGRDFAYLDRAATHRSEGAQPAQRWHRDGGAVHGPRVDCLQVFYLPQETTLEMGPTEVLPGSHHLFQQPQYMAHYERIRGAVYASAPAGSIFVTHYAIWHRRSRSVSPGVRNLLKFWYLRTTPPRRDWARCSDFTLEQAFHLPGGNSFGREMHLVRNQAAEMMYWLAGEHDVFASVVPNSNLPVYYFWDGARPAAS